MIKDTVNLKLNTAVVKIASRCNINCTYCYMYNKGDESYLEQPKIMTKETVVQLMKKVKRYCISNDIFSFQFIFHGGEPLLAGPEFFSFFIEQARKYLLPEVKPEYSMQTNAVLINDEWCDLFARYNIDIGISMDGTAELHDAFRVDHKGNGTYQAVVNGLKTLQQNVNCISKDIVPGILSVIDIQADPLAIYENYKALKIKYVNFLLPDNNYDHLPAGYNSLQELAEKRLYADWLIRLYQHWFEDTDAGKPNISIFKQIMKLLLGRDYTYDYFGRGTLNLIVVETNGDLEPADSLKICGDRFTKTGLNLFTNDLQEVHQNDMIRLYSLSKQALCRKCLACPVNDVCGGGFLPHRYNTDNGFNNPSVYCNDLLKLITTIQNSILAQLPEEVFESMGVAPLSFTDALRVIEEQIELVEEPDYAQELLKF